MQERAKLVGGKVTVWSKSESGTEVELTIPGGRAYSMATEGQRSGLGQKVLAKLFGQGKGKSEEQKAESGSDSSGLK